MKTGTMSLVTNNSRYKEKTSYLPGTDEIIFQEGPKETASVFSGLFLIHDDGSDFSILVNDNFFYNGLYTVSLTSGKIAWQHAEEAETSIWLGDLAGGGKVRVAASDKAWLGDPNFAPVAEWQRLNPLEMTVGVEAASGETALTIKMHNPTEEAQPAAIRLFPGPGLQLSPVAEAGSSCLGVTSGPE